MVLPSLNEIILLSFLVAFLAAFSATPFIIHNSKRVGLAGKDQNKLSKPLVPEMGGIAIVFGLSLGLLSSIAFGYNSLPFEKIVVLLGALATILLMGLIGTIDDLYALKRRVKAPLPFLSAIPLSAVRAGTRVMNLPFLGSVNFGSWYPLLVVPLGVGGASNAFNMLAGLNGLEAGMGIVMALAIALAAFSSNAVEALLVAVSLLGALLAFFYYNRYPARVFPGDVGTYTIGATIACAVIIGNLELLGFLLFLPYFLELIFKLKSRFLAQSFGIPQKDGTLKPPERKNSLTHHVMALRPLKEYQVVALLLLLESMVAIFALWFTVYS